MSTVTVVIPTFNEELNIVSAYERIKALFETQLIKYDFQLLYIDNDSKDKSRELISGLCNKDKRVQAIFNNPNFGLSK